MNKILILSIFTVMFFSCERNKEYGLDEGNIERNYQEKNNSETNLDSASLAEDDYSDENNQYDGPFEEPCMDFELMDVDGVNILHFSTMDCFKQMNAHLAYKVELLDNEFIENNSDLEEEAINQLEEELHFNEEQPLIDFEIENGFNSLRQRLEEEAYVYNGLEDVSGLVDPFYDIVYDESIQTLLNERHEVIIDNTIYKINQDGSYWVIQNLDFDALASVSRDASDEVVLSEIENANLIGFPPPEECSRDRERGKETVGKYRIKWKMKLFIAFYGGGLKVKVKGFKKKKKRWKKRRSYCVVGFKGKLCDADGHLTLGSNNWSYFKRSNKKRWSWKTRGSTKSKDKKITGYFHAVGITKVEVLDL